MRVQVSVVVPTYRRPHLLRHCIDALLKQNFPPNAYEVIIVDDGCSDETKSVVESFSEKNKLRRMETASWPGPEADSCPQIIYLAASQTQGPAAARNLGWRTARGNVIAFTDDDCLPDLHWLPEGITALTGDLAAVSGCVVVPIPNPPTDYEKNVAGLSHAEFVTANCFCYRWALETVGGFDESFPTAWREDSDLQFKMLRQSHKFGKAPNAKVIHPVRPAGWGVSIKEQRKSMFDALLYKKHPDLYRQRIKPGVPVKYYLIVFSLVGIAFSMLIHNRLSLKSFSFLWAGLTLQFVGQRLRQTKHTPSHVAEMLLTSIVIPPLSIFWRLVGAVRYRVWFF